MKNFILKGETNGKQITIDFTNTGVDSDTIRRVAEKKGIKVISILENKLGEQKNEHQQLHDSKRSIIPLGD